MRMINGCPSPDGPAFEPVYLVRAVNHLRAMGKDKAIAAMREYRRISNGPLPERHRIVPENLDTSNEYCLASLIPLLFPNLWDQSRPSGYDMRHVADFIRVESDLPFLTNRIGFRSTAYGGGETPFSTRILVASADTTGILRERPLRPPDDPIRCAENLLSKRFTSNTNEDSQKWLRMFVRKQAYRTVRHIVSTNYEESDTFARRHENPNSVEDDWQALKAEVVKLKVRWDEQKQEYVSGAK